MTIEAVPTKGGGHDITCDTFRDADQKNLVLLRVRPVGVIEWGRLPTFVHGWVPELVEALLLAQRICDRPKPWEPYEGD